MKISRKYLPIIGLLLMIFMTAQNAFLLIQATGDPIYLFLSFVTMPLLIVIIYVIIRLRSEEE